MKKIFIATAIAAIGLFVFSGCTKKSSGTSYAMHASVGGTSWNVSNVYAVSSGTELVITGNSGTSTTTATPPYLSISIFNYSGAGTYKVDSNSVTTTVDATYAPDNTLTNMTYSKSGSVTITSASSSTITGTFSFVQSNGTAISSGTFTARIP